MRTIHEEARDYITYTRLIKFLKLPFPVPDNLRRVLDARIEREYKLIKEKNSELPAAFRPVICRIVDEYEAKQKGGEN